MLRSLDMKDFMYPLNYMQYIIGACYHAFSLPKMRDNNNGPITPQRTLKIEGMQFVMLSTMRCVQKPSNVLLNSETFCVSS